MKKPGADACLNDGTTIRGSVNPCIFTRCDHRCDIHHLAPTNAVHGSRKASSVFGNSGYEPNDLFFPLKSTPVDQGRWPP